MLEARRGGVKFRASGEDESAKVRFGSSLALTGVVALPTMSTRPHDIIIYGASGYVTMASPV